MARPYTWSLPVVPIWYCQSLKRAQPQEPQWANRNHNLLQRCVFGSMFVGVFRGPAGHRALEYLSTRPGLSTVLQGTCARHESWRLGLDCRTLYPATTRRKLLEFNNQNDQRCAERTPKPKEPKRDSTTENDCFKAKLVPCNSNIWRHLILWSIKIVTSKLSNYVVWLSTIKFLHL